MSAYLMIDPIPFYCFLIDQVLLVTSNRFPDKWIVPAGGVEAGEEYQDAAVREVLEEVSGCKYSSKLRDPKRLIFK